jgi:hypothetical protein
MRALKVTGLLAVVVALLAMPGAALANDPIVQGNPPDPEGVLITFEDGSQVSCELAAMDVAEPPNPCVVSLALADPPTVELNPPDPDLTERGVIIDPGFILITFGDGSQVSCTISPETNPPDPDLPPNPLSCESTR